MIRNRIFFAPDTDTNPPGTAGTTPSDKITPPADPSQPTNAGEPDTLPDNPNPFAKANKPSVVKMAEVEIVGLASYETDGKHIRGHRVWVSEARADELISTGCGKHTGETVEVAPGDVQKQIAKGTAPVV